MTQAIRNISEKQINDLADALNRGDVKGALEALGLAPALTALGLAPVELRP